MSAINTLSQAALYAPGPFFCFPWKLLINSAYGSNYDAGFKHFWMQHKDYWNLTWHLVCLIFQLVGNIKFLCLAESYVFGAHSTIITAFSLVCWASYLLCARDCPLLVRVASIVVMLMVWWCTIVFDYSAGCEGFVLVAYAILYAMHTVYKGVRLTAGAFQIMLILGVKYVLCYYVMDGVRGILLPNSYCAAVVTWGYLFLIAAMASKTFLLPMSNQFLVVVFGACAGHTLSVLMNEPLLYYHSCAFTATLLQGLAHQWSFEQGTLQKLQSNQDKTKKIAYEYAHVVYFPNLLLHAVATALDFYSNS